MKLWEKLPWLWHAMFDGTRLCRCKHSQYYKEMGERMKRDGIWP